MHECPLLVASVISRSIASLLATVTERHRIEEKALRSLSDIWLSCMTCSP